MNMDRRNFLKATMTGLAGVAAPLLPFPAFAQDAALASANATVLKAVSRSLDINGKAANVYGLMQGNGVHGITLNAGSNFDVALHNELPDPTLIHWHGLLPPWPMDGVPDTPAPLLKAGESRGYLFPVADAGTYWMHAHTLQEQNLLAAPLIVRSAADAKADQQEVVILLHDFSFTPAGDLLAKLKKTSGGMGMNMGGMNMTGIDQTMMTAHMAHTRQMMATMRPGGGMAGMGAMDLNDIQYDAYLANDRTLADPQVITVEKNGHVRLRIINGATATAFTIDTGRLGGELIAVDGQDIVPVKGASFPIVMGQRLDIRLTLPKDGGAFPILALREGANERAGVILATARAPIAKTPVLGDRKAPVIDLVLENKLKPARPLAQRAPDRRYSVRLVGNMSGYEWGMDGADNLKVSKGQRVEIAMLNMSMMTHPMHLHGHRFKVVGIDGKTVNGAVRDTVAVPPMSTVTIAFDASNTGRWAFHCHHLYHMATGMMSFVEYMA
jgi:FtsP/CotA-like multicopper oxidase with cupredoxin domain